MTDAPSAATRALVTVTEAILVARSPKEVFDFTQDYTRRSEWDRYITDATVLSEEPRRIRVTVAQVGSYTIEYRLFRRGERTSARFVDVDSAWLVGGGGSWRYEPVDGATRWIQTNTFEIKASILLSLASPLIRFVLRRSVRRAMARAKRIMEG